MLVACDNNTQVPGMAVPHRIDMWDTADGSLSHQLSLPSRLPPSFDISPNGRNLVAMFQDADCMKLSVWRLDGENIVREDGPMPPATIERH